MSVTEFSFPEMNLFVEILGDVDEASQWKETNCASDIIIQNDIESDQETETQEIEVNCIKVFCDFQSIENSGLI